MSEEGQTGGQSSVETPQDNNLSLVTMGGENLKQEQQPIDIKNLIPAEFKDKPYLKDVDSVEKLFKKLDGAEKLIGQKPFSIPQDNAPEDVWNEFYDKAGRPKKPEEYELNIENDKDFENFLRNVSYETGLSNRQAKILNEKFNNFILEKVNYEKQQQEELDKEFDKLAVETYGKEQDKVIEVAKNLLQAHAPEKFKEHINSLDNKTLVALSGVLYDIHQKYMKEDNLLSNGGGSAPITAAERSARVLELTKHPAFNNPQHPEHRKIVDEWNKLYKK